LEYIVLTQKDGFIAINEHGNCRKNISPDDISNNINLHCGKYKEFQGKVDLELLCLHMGIKIQPDDSFLKPLIKISDELEYDKNNPHISLGRGYNNYCVRKIKHCKSLIKNGEITIQDIKYYDKYIKPRVRINNSFVSFLHNSEKTKVRFMDTPTITGRFRMNERSKFNPLIIKKEDRSSVSSLKNNEIVVQVDFKAIEFRLAMEEFGINHISNQIDPYSYMADLIGIKGPRNEIKEILISIMYGKKFKNINMDLGQRADLLIWYSNTIEKPKKEIVEIARKQISEKGYFTTKSGRRVYEPNDAPDQKIINNIFQTFSQDIIVYEFDRLIEDIKNSGLKMSPIFSIHDSLVFVCSQKDFEIAKSKYTYLGGYPVSWSLFNGD
jgi:hypothetical protein